jgi:Mg-chelatase subunit ChlD
MKFSLLALIFCLSLSVYGQQAAQPSMVTPLQYVVLNDASRLTLWPKGTQQQVNVATQFLRQVVTPGSDVGSLVNFSDEVFLDIVNSTNPGDIANKLVSRGRGGTAIYESIVSSVRWLSKQKSPDRRKVVFVFSDGADDASQMSLKDAIKAVQTMHIPVFVIVPSVVEHKNSGKNMKQLAVASGGQAYFVDDSSGFDFGLLKRDLDR